MSLRQALLLALMVGIPSLSSAQANPKADPVSAARAAIEAANAKFTQAFERGDATALAAMYTTDAIVFPPDSEMVRGNAAIGEFWRQTRNSGVKSATLRTVDVGQSGGLAYEVGTVSLTVQAEGSAATTLAAKYLVVWQLQADGSWKLHRDIWNSLPPVK